MQTIAIVIVSLERFYYREAISLYVSMSAIEMYTWHSLWTHRQVKSKEVQWFHVFLK